jgi:ubiquinone/menaquinone biosynthesis C-methylase UbiE
MDPTVDTTSADPATAVRDDRGERPGQDFDYKKANVEYHDWEASQYDEKWSISFDERCITYARDRFLKVAPEQRYGKVLEIGGGTGFFIINLAQAGLVEEAYATDISPGMVKVCQRNAEHAGLTVQARTADAEALPFEDDTFDLVIGHAVLHHLPDVPAALAEAYRVLKPGGRMVIAGEPTRIGFQIVGVAKRTTAKVMRAIGPRFGWLRSGGHEDAAAALEAHVDIHEFHPHMVRGWARDAGFTDVDVQTEELASGLFGWSARTMEALARPDLLPAWWPFFAYETWMRLNRFDDLVLRRVLPKAVFYNLLLGARKP